MYSEKGGSCYGKKVYRTIGECERAMRKLRKRTLASRHKTHPYHWCTCNGWHLTSMSAGDYDERAHYRVAPGEV